ncbi:hypothetical protein Q1695_010677 [Nippostrongylus brasiliensis]|nr:hypothetical protein Q1695_010677 [Nippostrongylus brasiliensis]
MASNEIDVASDFYDIDAILSQLTKVECIFAAETPTEVYELLGTCAPQQVDEKGYRVLTPFWLAKALEQLCTLGLPTAYNSNARNVLLANAEHADLESLQPYFYETGMQLTTTLSENAAVIVADILLKTMIQRVGGIVLSTFRGSGPPKKIDNLEKTLYDEGMRSRRRMEDYLRAQQFNKRKRRHD